MAQKRFDVTYVSNNGESQVLFDKQSNGRGETYGILKFDGRILNIHSDENKYTVIKILNKIKKSQVGNKMVTMHMLRGRVSYMKRIIYYLY